MTSVSSPRSKTLRRINLVFAWLWVAGVLIAYISGYADVIRLLIGALFGTEAT
jgi:hypothetical protein